MKITRTARLEFGEQLPAFLESVRNFNAACNWLSGVAFAEKIWHWLPLQRRVYGELRERFGLSSAATVTAVRKVAYAYRNKARRARPARFRPLGAMTVYRHAYKRDGTVRFYGFRVPFKCAPGAVLSSKCEAKLVVRKNRVILLQSVEVPESETAPAEDYLGVDLGIVNIATDSDGETFSGAHTNGLRRRHNRLRARLQRKGTQSARRFLRLRSGRESRFARCINHRISKRLVAKAHGSGRGIALEDLRGIRTRIKARKAQRGVLHSWAFAQLRGFIEYKARLSGVPVATVNPRNTSRTCPRCGHISKRNRPTRDLFKCVGCGLAGPADHIAAENIGRAAGNRPYAVAAQC